MSAQQDEAFTAALTAALDGDEKLGEQIIGQEAPDLAGIFATTLCFVERAAKAEGRDPVALWADYQLGMRVSPVDARKAFG